MRSLQDIYRGPHQFAMHRWDHYITAYEQWFAPWRDQEIKLLEIGVQHGGGLEMWHKYFHRAELILGIDINPACQYPQEPNIKVEIGDQADLTFLTKIIEKYGPFNIIIDDGGHKWRQQIESFAMLYLQVTTPGLYVVEDLHTSVWGGEFADAPKSFMDVAAGHAEALMGWSGDRGNFAKLMNLGGMTQAEMQRMRASVSEFTRTTVGMHVYDSLIIYERGNRDLPAHALR
jgi:hypothetical protein